MDLKHNKDNSEVIGENSHLLQRKNSAEFYAAHFPHKNTTNFQVKHITNPYLRFSLRAWFRVTTALLLVVITSLACAWVNESQEIDVTTTSYETIGILLAFLLGTRSVQAAARWSDGSTKVYDGIHFILRIATRIASIPNLSDSNAKYDSRKRSNSKIRLPTALEKIQVNCKRYLKALYHVEFVQLKDLFDLDYSTVPFHYLLHEDEKSMLSKSHAPEFLLAKWLYEEVNEYDIGLEIRQDIFNFLNTWRQAKQVKDIHMKMPFEKSIFDHSYGIYSGFTHLFGQIFQMVYFCTFYYIRCHPFTY